MTDKLVQHIRWTDETTGYECIANAIPWWCGYVRIPDDHPWRDMGYNSPLCGHDGCYQHTPEGLISVHGGITFSGTPHGTTEGNWFGFDCAHYGDYTGVLPNDEGHHWTIDEVKTECASLAKQIAGAI